MSPLFLVIDAGSGGAKAFIVDEHGRISAEAQLPWDRSTWTPSLGWDSISRAVRDVLHRGNVDPGLIGAVGVTSMREEFILLDHQGSWVRADAGESSCEYGERLLRDYGARMYDASGHWPVPNWIAGSLLPWLRSERPEELAKVKHFFMVADWVAYRLTGRAATDGSNACESALYDIVRRGWAWSLIEELGLPAGIFPEPVGSGEQVGALTANASRDTGVPEGTPVVLGGADTQCGLLGMAVGPGEAGAVGGTTTPVQALIERPVLDPDRRLWTGCHVTRGLWVLESNAGFTGRAVGWLRDWAGSGGDYSRLNDEAAAVPPGSNGLLSFFGPHVFNSGPPYWEHDRLGDVDAPPVILGKHSFTFGELARSILEANCFAVKANIEQITMVCGAGFSHLKFCGGNAKSSLWMQMQADVLGVPIILPEVLDGTAVGVGVLAAVGSGHYRDVDEALRAMVRIRKPIRPDPVNHEKYGLLYERWLSVRSRVSGTL
jgi:sugar (pentulose or hexulose) kinase